MAGLNVKQWHERILNQSKWGWLKKLQQEQMDAFLAQGLPTKKMEDWHYTDVSSLENCTLQLSQKIHTNIAFQALRSESFLCVFVDGVFSPALSCIQKLPNGVILSNIRTVLEKQPDLLKEYLLPLSRQSEKKAFLAFNTAMLSDGLFLYVPHHVQLKQPVHILGFSTAETHHEHNTAHLRHIVVGGENSGITVFEEYQGRRGFYFNTVVTQSYVGKRSTLHHYKLQNEGEAAYHIAYMIAKQEEDSRVYLNNFSFGGSLSRENIEIYLEGKAAHCQLHGLYVLKGQQHMDHHIRVHHQSSHSSSEQFYRGMVDEEATAVFNGRVVVHAGAQKSKAKQSNQNIILSKSAAVNTKPEFEIYAEDVECSHGATVGNIDPLAVFYLQSRGLDEQAARHLLMHAFSEVILKQIAVPEIQEKMAVFIHEKEKKNKKRGDCA